MKKNRKLLKKLGPGFITGAADDDPSGIGTYAQTGAQFGFSQLWLALFSFPFMTVIQEMCGRIGLVTGKGLATVVRDHYARPVLFGSVLLLFIANAINVGSDLGAMAASAQLVFGIPFIFWLVGFTILIIALEIAVPYPTYAKFLKYLALSLLAYIVTAFIVKQDWTTIFHATIVPSFSLNKDYIMNIVAILGTTISPYLFFWEADQESEENIAHHRMIKKVLPKTTRKYIWGMRIDTIIGMFMSNLVMFFIVITAASTLGVHGIQSISTADQAAQALKPLAGNFASLIFALGIIGTGMLAVPVLAGSAAYAFAESMKWKAGLHYKFKQAHAFYIIIIVATLVGVLINLTPIKPFQLLYYTAILNGIMAPPLMILILRVSNNKKIMGDYTNGFFSNAMGWIITAIMSIAAIALFIPIGK